MKSKVILAVLILGLAITSCKENRIKDLCITSFSLVNSYDVSTDLFEINVIDSSDYYNDILFTQKIELSLQSLIPSLKKYGSIEVTLNMPMRSDPIVNYKVNGDMLKKTLPLRYSNKGYREFTQKLIERLNSNNEFDEMDMMNSAFQIAKNGSDSKADWFGLNSLDIFYEKFENTKETNEEFNKLFSDFSDVLNKANPILEEKNTDMYNFLVEELNIQK